MSTGPMPPDSLGVPNINDHFSESRLRLRTESGVGMPVSPYIASDWSLLASAAGMTAPMPFLAPALGGLGLPQGVLSHGPFGGDVQLGAPTHAPMTMPAHQGIPTGEVQPPVQRIQLTNLVGAPSPLHANVSASYVPYAQPLHLHTQIAPPVQAQQRKLAAKAVPQQQVAPYKVAGGCAAAGKAPTQAPCLDGPRTTVMLRNLPDGFTRNLLLHLLDSQGFAGRYDFAYLPVDFDTLQGLNHAFVNLLTPADADELRARLEGFSEWGMDTQAACTVAWNDRQQGLSALVERYRNSPVMHDTVPDECKPIIIMGGRRAQFPPPTQKIKAPKILKGRVL